MEQDKNNDHLDRFMHRAFDDFAANPSDGLWDKISSDLPEAHSTPPAKVVPIIRPWHIAASAALILGLFLSQHYYFSSKIDALRDEMQQSAATPASNDSGKVIQQAPGQITEQNLVNKPANANPYQDAQKPSSVSNGTPIDFYSTPANNTKKTSESKLPAAKKPSGVDAIPGLQTAPPAHSGTPEMAVNTNERLNSTEKTDDQSAKNVQKDLKVAAFAVIPSNDLPGSLNSNTTRPQLQFIGEPYITKVSPGLHTILSAHVMPGFIHSKVKVPQQSGWPPNGERIFSDEKQTGSALMAGLGIEKQVNKHFSVVSGIDYLKYTIEQTLPSPLKFKDRDHGPGGPGGPGGPHNDEHDFNYSFGTGNGSYSVDVELRAVDSTQQIDEDEQIDLELKTKHQVSFLSIPLALKYRLTHKHWSAFAMAGARVNYEVQNNETVSDFTCNNARFEFRNKPELVRKSSEVRKVTSDLIAAAGLEYRVRNLSFSLAPTFSTPVVKPVKDDRVSVSTYTAGINAGVQYYF